MLQNNPELKSKIDQLWDRFWSGGISNPLSAIEQMTYLLFMKRLDELDLEKLEAAASRGEEYVSRFTGDKHSLRWSELRRMPPDQMLQHVQDRVFPFLKELNGVDSPFTRYMQNAVFIIPKPTLLAEAVKTIDEIFEVMLRDARDGGQAFQDIQGDVYELLLSEIASAGKNGQFRTPRHIIKLMVELVQPQPGQKFVDPACGSGGFLLGAYQYLVTRLTLAAGTTHPKADEDGFVRAPATSLTKNTQSALAGSLWGYDIDSTMVRLGLMNLVMHGVDEPNIGYRDTLSKSHDEESVYDVVMANPPFTGSVDRSDINGNLLLATTKTELLFVENIYRLLKKGGTACVIVPQGVLFSCGAAFKALRRLLIERCELDAVIAMPSGVFKPYAGVRTAILLFTKIWGPKEKLTKPATQHVWFYDMAADGYSLDDKRTKLQGHGDLQDIVNRYNTRDATVDTDRTQKCFMVPRADIEAEGYDLTFGRYRQAIFQDVRYEPPSDILNRLLEAEVGDAGDEDLAKVSSGIVRELLDLRRTIGG